MVQVIPSVEEAALAAFVALAEPVAKVMLPTELVALVALVEQKALLALEGLKDFAALVAALAVALVAPPAAADSEPKLDLAVRD